MCYYKTCRPAIVYGQLLPFDSLFVDHDSDISIFSERRASNWWLLVPWEDVGSTWQQLFNRPRRNFSSQVSRPVSVAYHIKLCHFYSTRSFHTALISHHVGKHCGALVLFNDFNFGSLLTIQFYRLQLFRKILIYEQTVMASKSFAFQNFTSGKHTKTHV